MEGKAAQVQCVLHVRAMGSMLDSVDGPVIGQPLTIFVIRKMRT